MRIDVAKDLQFAQKRFHLLKQARCERDGNPISKR